MIILRGSGGDSSHVILLFGLGLVGRSIQRSILRISHGVESFQPFSWTDPERRSIEAASIVATALGSQTPSIVDVVWAAGRAGFGSSSEELSVERRSLQDVLSIASELVERVPLMRFHLVTSAGGLFEGQVRVTRHSVPSPKRPYGAAKLDQEALMQASLKRGIGLIYRLASVYGYAGPGLRLGLTNTLIRNSIKGRTTTMYGDMHAIRDYVFVDDIGDYVAAQVMGRPQDGIHLLASAKATSTVEMVNLVQRVLRARARVTWRVAATNSEPISYSADALPGDFWPTDLDTGVRLTVRRMREGYWV